ncbi:NUDIX hydrolase [Alkaliphilus metalliredigens QYMF]|uniref:NUDIX hydrolase n=1 Tax=Alkaliphilus metalliredigens (strain QYMF) TaxID=293826 RepID=A6TS98_ALKMQ|nr:CoA pyrophosphatase [Alkaliphilus metalliredigens]ABR49066.1 NUDIX hydrolase [Alkaliphilus metalliredigens QYMF]
MKKYAGIIEAFQKRNLAYEQHSSVLVPLIERDGELHVLFEVRSLQMNHQPGEICFPGGKIEKNEAPKEGALRETTEELNIKKDHIHIIGEIQPIITPFHMTIYSYCGILKDIAFEDIAFNPSEVHSLFTVPLRFLLEVTPLIHHVENKMYPKDDFPYHLIQSGRNYHWKTGDYEVYFYEYGDYMIWGITAKILNHFLKILKDY